MISGCWKKNNDTNEKMCKYADVQMNPLIKYRHCEAGFLPCRGNPQLFVNKVSINVTRLSSSRGLPRARTLAMTMTIWVFIQLTSCINNEKKLEANRPSHPVIPSVTVHLPDTAFTIQNGVGMYHLKPFSGTLMEHYDSAHIKSSIQYFNGKQEGTELSYFHNGQKEALRFYTGGEKDSLHTGWWPNGNKRFEYHFINGAYDGNFTEWYEGGKLGKEIIYKNGEELSGKGWRENGKLYMCYVMKDGRRYGLVNAQLCYTLKNERGEYVK
jgi:hypothetical protein